jgi:glycosyltransferase involved in cell wall biosynthesis
MRVIHFSTYGPVGGAGKAAYGIHSGLLKAGCDSRMVVAHAAGNHDGVSEWPGVKERVELSRTATAELEPRSDFNPDLSPVFGSRGEEWDFIDVPDIIHLHWIAGFVFASDIRQLYERYRTPIVWTMPDMHPLTGGCHYSNGCQRFAERCGSCPVLQSDQENDASRRSWLSKSEWLKDLPITVVSISAWSDALARESSIFASAPRFIIPYGIDDSFFRIRRRDGARRLLKLPDDARIVMFGAANHRDERKGTKYMVDALERLPALLEPGPQVIVLAVGSSEDYRTRISLPVVELGTVGDDRLMALAYQASDVFVCTSLEDAGPMMIPEALLCGTPVVAFDAAGFAADLIKAPTNGYLARTADARDLASGMAQVLTLSVAGGLVEEQCRASALPRYGAAAQAAAYIELYDELIDGHWPHAAPARYHL